MQKHKALRAAKGRDVSKIDDREEKIGENIKDRKTFIYEEKNLFHRPRQKIPSQLESLLRKKSYYEKYLLLLEHRDLLIILHYPPKEKIIPEPIRLVRKHITLINNQIEALKKEL